MTKQHDATKAAEYDAIIQSLPETRESAKKILDLSDGEYVVVADHPHEDSMTVAAHISVANLHHAICSLLTTLTDDEDFPPLPDALKALGVTDSRARKIVVATTILDRFGLSSHDVEIAAGIIKRRHEVRGPSSIEA